MAIIEFDSLDEVQAYVDTVLVPNGSGLITADEHNSIESGLIKFIRQAPSNGGSGAKVISQIGPYIADGSAPVLIFSSNSSGPLTLPNNQWNEWTIVNQSAFNKQLSGGVVTTYYLPSGSARTWVPQGTAIHVLKADNGKWYEVSSQGVNGDTENNFITVDTVEEMDDLYDELVEQEYQNQFDFFVTIDNRNMGGKKGAYKYVPGFTTSPSQIAINFND